MATAEATSVHIIPEKAQWSWIRIIGTTTLLVALGFAVRHGELLLTQILAADFEQTWDSVRPMLLGWKASTFLTGVVATVYFLMRGKFEDPRLLSVAIGGLVMLSTPMFNSLRSLESGASDTLSMLSTVRDRGEASSREQEVLGAIANENHQAINEFRWALRGQLFEETIALADEVGVTTTGYKAAGFMTHSDLVAMREKVWKQGASTETLDKLGTFIKRTKPLDLSP